MDASDVEPRILSVEIPPRSTATYRAIYGEDDIDTYSVVLTVSVPIDGFIEQAMTRTPRGYPRELYFDNVDRMKVEIIDTTLHEVHDKLDELREWLATAVSRAAEARRAADLEDDKLSALVEEINQKLRENQDGR